MPLSFSLNVEVQKHLRSLTPKFGFGGFGELVYFRTYSRVMPDGRQESWADTVIRVINGVFSIRKNHYQQNRLPWHEEATQKLAGEMAVSMFAMEWLPPGRGLWAMGAEYVFERGSAALNNCGATKSEGLAESAAWAMDMLMCGVGIGADMSWDGLATPPDKLNPEVFVIPDSREGWVESVFRLVASYTKGSAFPAFMYDEIRGPGSPIRGFGGTASGPDPLKLLHQRIEAILDDYCAGRIDKTRCVADVKNAIGACVVAGNVRRSAEILLGSVSDATFLNLKNYALYPERGEIGWMSNNSVVLQSHDDFAQLPMIAERIRDNGEPGLINLINVQKFGRYGEPRPDAASLFNPCFPGDVQVWTADGHVSFKDLAEAGNPVQVLTQTDDGKLVYRTMRNPRKTRVGSDLVRVTFTDGSSVRCTPNHKFYLKGGAGVAATQLKEGDSIDSVYRRIANSKGYYRLRGRHHKPLEHHIPFGDIPARFQVHHLNEDKQDNRPSNLVLLGGALHRAHHMAGDRNPTRRNPEWASRDMSGSKNPRYLHDLDEGEIRDMREGGLSFLTIAKELGVSKYTVMKRLGWERPNNHKVLRVDVLEEKEDVYCGTVDDTAKFFVALSDHDGVLVSNCGEQPLEDKELCTLVEVFPSRCVTVEALHRAMGYATWYASTVTLLPTHSPATNAVMQRNRRIGVSISGVTELLAKVGASGMTRILRDGYKKVRKVNAELAKEAGTPESVRVTTVKPSGSISQLAGCSPGAHFPTFSHAIRRIRVGNNTPIGGFLRDRLPYEDDTYSDNTSVFSFPIQCDNARPAKEVSAWEQFSLLAMLQREWSDNAVSQTIYFDREKEGHQVEHMLAQFAPLVKSVSMLPHTDAGAYKQMPYEGITRAQYREMRKETPKIDWREFTGGDGQDSRFCTNDTCALQ